MDGEPEHERNQSDNQLNVAKNWKKKKKGSVRLAQTGQAYLAIGYRQKRFPPQNIPSLLLVTRLNEFAA